MLPIILLSIIGLIDSIYLTIEHYSKTIPFCPLYPIPILNIVNDCGRVLKSPYSEIFGIPLALIGVFNYGLILLITLYLTFKNNKLIKWFLIIQSTLSFLASLYFMYLQIFILQSICMYCTLSAIISTLIFLYTHKKFNQEKFELHLLIYQLTYQYIIKPILFLFDPEFIHEKMILLGKVIAKTPLIYLIKTKFEYHRPLLEKKLAGINFKTPVGLAAGFDYNADLIDVLPNLDFGFHTVGTITNLPYEGNSKPRLGRLPKSKSLMVNKGFKNIGVKKIIEKLKNKTFKIPLGISIGVSNNKKIKTINQAINDIYQAFYKIEKAKIKNSYYELNISCPNLLNLKNLDFYTAKNLNLLLKKLKKLNLKKPVFVKMPISISNQQFDNLLKTIVKYQFIKGVIIGNLQKDRNNEFLDKQELKKYPIGNFSGKPCEKRSNELIAYARKRYKNKLIIIGCGGVFSFEDAMKKIRLGANLIQLITGIIYEGPQLIAQINFKKKYYENH